MKGDRSVSLWEVKIPIKGSISIEQDGIEMDDVTFHLDEKGFSAKTIVEGSPNDMIIEAMQRVNRAVDKIAFETGASLRIEKNGIIANRVSKPIGETTGEVIDSRACIIIKLKRPAIDEDTLIGAAKWGSNLIDNDDYKYFQKSLSHYRNGLNAESDGNPSAFLDFWNSIEVITVKYGKRGKTKDKICDCFEKCFGERKEDEVKELYEIRVSAAHGSKDLSNPEKVKIIIGKTPQMKKLAKQFLSSWSKLQSTKLNTGYSDL